MSLIFQIVDGLGLFLPKNVELYNKQQEAITELIDAGHEDNISISKVTKGLKRLLRKDPLCFQGWALLGEILEDLGESDENIWEVYASGCQAALEIMPSDFAEPLNTENVEVQCFLRCHSKYIESLVDKKQYFLALDAVHRQLAFDSEDMFDQELELGELSLLAGETQEAEDILFSQVEYRPTAYYTLGHMAFGRGDFMLAASYLRRAFILAPYTVAILTGRPMPPNLFWECGPEAPDFRENLSYMEMLGAELWGTDEAVHSFLYWLSQTAVVLKEHATFVELSEKCFVGCLGDSSDSSDTFDLEVETKFDEIMAGIDDESSAALVVLVEDPENEAKLRPWELLVLHHKRMAEDDDFGDCDINCACGTCDDEESTSK